MEKKKFFLLTTVSISLEFFRGQIMELGNIFDVTLISSSSSQLKNIAQREKVNYKDINIERSISLMNDIISLIKLFLFFISKKPYIIHCNTPKASLLGLIAGKLAFVPRRVYYIHGLRYEGEYGTKRRLLIFLEKIACACATDIIAVSKGVKKIVEKDLTKKKVVVIHNGSSNGLIVNEFDSTKYNVSEIRKELNISSDDFIYGFVGRIVKDKGINELIHAFENQKIKGSKLLLVGFREEELDPVDVETKKIIENNPNIIEVGFQEDVKKYLSIMDIFVSPSYREGFGLSLIEANLMGIPVIGTKITGYSEIIQEGVNGFLIPVKDQEALEKKMVWAKENNNEIKKMNDYCKSLIVENYNHIDVVTSALAYYNKL
ncbi:glycosyltransferase family 4 protein [Epilithonimonas arachidiradicis]|uniref:Glycosyltransferase involved in cell wall biosynthesis n=1 Tax=Epilithonimonas arachidiradicis TaxID=1617282 RepID=A0A420CIS6_9FLAO|nr:glycosyltransferase family 4 protein [Epilithonimonas arachidiradicis]RKE78370.1 glycosyltransferase involved in cell wall biosynthesis [Epilithonimonas arachidiradicis]GGG67195.1 hypothetical protein GCM10007332_32510 [Epilithonimonas arachidiradicis]